MNQAIQFPEREHWDEANSAVCFPALVNGMLVTCAITGATLERRFGDAAALSAFRDHRWDLEEEASDAIREGQEDDRGWFWLS